MLTSKYIAMKKIWIVIAVLAGLIEVKSQTFSLLSDINPNGGSYPGGFLEYNGLMYFKAQQTNNGAQYLFRSDGTSWGTYIVPYLNGNTIPYSPNDVTEFNDKLFFRAYDTNGDNELWTSDGTASGTQILKNINSTSNSFPSGFIKLGSMLLFSADDGINGSELWKTDGTSAGTQLLIDINPNEGSYPGFFTELNGLIYFRADDGVHGMELWKTDGTVNGTQLVKDMNPTEGSDPYNFGEFNGKLFFTAQNMQDTNTFYANREPWVSDGTEAGTFQLKEIWDDTIKGSHPTEITEYNGNGYFKAYNGSGYGLWKTDGTIAGTQLVKSLSVNSDYDIKPIVYNDKIYFSAYFESETESGQIWQSDGTPQGTFKIKGFSGSPPETYGTYNNKLYFKANAASGVNNDYRLWESDGTLNGTHLTEPAIAPNANPTSQTGEFFEFDGSLYFAAGFDNADVEVWKLSATSTGLNVGDASFKASLYPNPTKDYVKVSIPDSIIAASFTLYNCLGQSVYTTSVVSGEEINLHDYAAGVYSYKLHTDTNLASGKLILE